MADPRFYCSEPISSGQTLELPAALAHHVRVRRLEAGSTVILFDGKGGEITGTLLFQDKTAAVLLGKHQQRECELDGEITLLQGLPAGDKMDWIIENAVELGVTRILPIAANRSVLKLAGPRLEKRLEHWRAIVVSASEQCGRNRLMQISAPQSFEQAILATPAGLRLLCDPEAEHTLAKQLAAEDKTQNNIRSVSLLIGPEGGWSPEETSVAAAQQAVPVKFGLRVLRTETAGIALAAATAALLGW